MTDIVIHRPNAETGRRTIAAMLGCELQRAMIAQEARIALNDLPDILLDDIGIPRHEIPYVAGVIAAERCEPRPKADGWFDRDMAAAGTGLRSLPRVVARAALVTLISASVLVLSNVAFVAGARGADRVADVPISEPGTQVENAG